MKYSPGKMKYFKQVKSNILLYLSVGVPAVVAVFMIVIVFLVWKLRKQKKKSKMAREKKQGLNYQITESTEW